jgi:hypothetical protein
MRYELPSDLEPLERRAVEAALDEYFGAGSVRPNPWMLAGRATALGLGALQIRHAARNPWDARFHPFSPIAPDLLMGRGDSK